MRNLLWSLLICLCLAASPVFGAAITDKSIGGLIDLFQDGATTEILVGAGAATIPVWGDDLPTAVKIGSAYIYRVGGTDVNDANVEDDITVTSTKKISTLLTTEQLRLSYDAGNYLTVTLLDDGHTTFVTVDPDGAEADINFDPDGNVGIKTAAPSVALEVTGAIKASGALTALGNLNLGADDDIAHAYIHHAGTLVFNDASDDTTVTLGPVADGTITLGITGGLSVSGNIEAATLTEGGNAVPNVTDNLSVFASTTSAQLSGVISDETGTLKFVLSDSPVFTTKITTPIIDLTGGQIAFPATAVPSADPNTLDDYQKGSWTITLVPSTSGTITLEGAVDEGFYVKIGSLVFVSGRATVASVSSPVGAIKVSLPFALGDKAEYGEVFGGSIGAENVNWAGDYIITKGVAGASYFYIGEITTNASETNVDGADFSAADYIYFGFCYHT